MQVSKGLASLLTQFRRFRRAKVSKGLASLLTQFRRSLLTQFRRAGQLVDADSDLELSGALDCDWPGYLASA